MNLLEKSLCLHDMSAQRSRVDPMKDDADVFPKRILDSIELIKEYTKGRSKQRFINSIEKQDAASFI